MAVVIVTGASSGIGAATALRLGRPSNTIVLAARRAEELAGVAREIETNGGVAHSVPTDVRDAAAIAALIEGTRRTHGRIDVLVNNAGIGGIASVLADDDDVDRMIDVNLRAPIRLMRAVVPIMLEQRSGHIVNIGSVAGEVGISGTYSATKFALRGMTDSVRRELRGTGVHVTIVEPGYIATAFNADRKNLPGPEVVAEAVASAVKRPRRRIIVPGKYRAAVLLSNALPMVTDRIYGGKAASRRGLKTR
jgi:short-subunit dehydrogenase